MADDGPDLDVPVRLRRPVAGRTRPASASSASRPSTPSRAPRSRSRAAPRSRPTRASARREPAAARARCAATPCCCGSARASRPSTSARAGVAAARGDELVGDVGHPSGAAGRAAARSRAAARASSRSARARRGPPWRSRSPTRERTRALLRPDRAPRARLVPRPRRRRARAADRADRRPGRGGPARPAVRTFDFVFIDGSHERERTIATFEAWRDHVAPGGVIAFHDWENPAYPGVTEAIREMGLDGEVRGDVFVWSTSARGRAATSAAGTPRAARPAAAAGAAGAAAVPVPSGGRSFDGHQLVSPNTVPARARSACARGTCRAAPRARPRSRARAGCRAAASSAPRTSRPARCRRS